jgi:phospholipid-binding lipoprotein MlaA
MKSLVKLIAWTGLLVLIGTGCATRTPYEDASDPLEPVNRVIYTFNDYLDRGVLKPVAQMYVEYVPATARTGVRNFYNNLFEPITIVNQVLQGKGHEAANDTMRFGFNTIFGLLGLIDVATGWGLEHHTEDFGQTFAVWGFGEGWYLVLPLLGPSNVRDTVGLIPEMRLQPMQYIDDTTLKYSAYTLFFISRRADLLSASKVLDSASLDPYLQVREAYRQKRWNEIHDGKPPEPDFFDKELFGE